MRTALKNETKVNGLTVKLYEGLDGDYHVTREDSEQVHDHEIFDDFDKAKAFFASLVEEEYQTKKHNL